MRSAFQKTPEPTTEKESEFSIATIDQKFALVPSAGTYKGYKLDLGNQVDIEMIFIFGGNVKLGSPPEEDGRNSDEEPLDVMVEPFYMSRYPITQAQWKKVAKLPKVDRELQDNPSTFENNFRPVETISWEEAQEFCKRISKNSEWRYRLPKEREWEYACRAETTTPFHFGETITPEVANYDCSYSYRSGQKNQPEKYRGETALVKDDPSVQSSANKFGLEGMHGNVWEWCEDVYSKTHKEALNNTSSQGNRVIRGGAWNSFPKDCRSAKRNFKPQTFRSNTIGFRIVRTFEES